MCSFDILLVMNFVNSFICKMRKKIEKQMQTKEEKKETEDVNSILFT